MATPDSVGPYRIVRKLGSGGMGDVYLADDTRLGRQVALKSLSQKWAQAPDARRRLTHEARAAAGLNHTNIAAVYDVVETADSSWIVMEYAPGESLAEALRQGPLPPEAVVWVGVQMCDALGAAHSRGIVHRDLKPANLVMGPDGHLKVLDFGLAKSLDFDRAVLGDSSAALDLSGGGRLVGTLPYVPPEHILGEKVDERSDLYTAGVVLFELLTGRRPYDGPDKKTIAQAIVDGRPPDLATLRPELPDELVRVVRRAMARDPGDRPATAATLRAELQQLSGAQSGWKTLTDLERPFGLRTSSSALRRRSRRRAFLLVGAGMLAALGGGALYRWATRASTPSRVPVVAVLPLLDASGDTRNEALGLGLADVLVSSLSRLPGSNVLARSAAAGYRERARNPMRIARELGVDFLVDGLLQRSGEDLRVTLSLIQSPSGVVVWSDVYDGRANEPFALQKNVAEALAGALRLRLTPETLANIRRAPSVAGGAFADYARARELLEEADVGGNLEQAVALFENALAKDPKFALAAAGLGQAAWTRYQRTRDPRWAERAREATRMALALDPDQPLVRIALSTIEAGSGRLREAEGELRRAIAQQPDNSEAHEALGRVLSEQGRKAEAVAALQKAVVLRPAYWQHQDALGLAFFDAGRYADAVEAFQRVTVLRPESARAFHQLGTAQQAQGDPTGALGSYERALALEPDGDTWSNVGNLKFARGQVQEAAEAFSRAIALQPAEPITHRNLGDAYARLGRADEARAEYRRAAALTREQLRVNPKDARGLARLAVYHAKLAEHAEARRVAEEALSLAPATPDVLYYVAVAYTLGGNAERALEVLTQALEAGFSPELAQDDDDLSSLRELPAYRRLLQSEAKH
jgi:serine/threonine protein kinase/tetratricopeptide (TPR) repeat protein